MSGFNSFVNLDKALNDTLAIGDLNDSQKLYLNSARMNYSDGKEDKPVEATDTLLTSAPTQKVLMSRNQSSNTRSSKNIIALKQCKKTNDSFYLNEPNYNNANTKQFQETFNFVKKDGKEQSPRYLYDRFSE